MQIKLKVETIIWFVLIFIFYSYFYFLPDWVKLCLSLDNLNNVIEHQHLLIVLHLITSCQINYINGWYHKNIDLLLFKKIWSMKIQILRSIIPEKNKLGLRQYISFTKILLDNQSRWLTFVPFVAFDSKIDVLCFLCYDFKAVLRLLCFYFAQKQHFIYVPCLVYVFIHWMWLLMHTSLHICNLHTKHIFHACIENSFSFSFARYNISIFSSVHDEMHGRIWPEGPNNCMVNKEMQRFSFKVTKGWFENILEIKF